MKHATHTQERTVNYTAANAATRRRLGAELAAATTYAARLDLTRRIATLDRILEGVAA